jgi:hypothetical protein
MTRMTTILTMKTNTKQTRTDLIRKVENEVVKSEKRDTVARLKAIFYM